MGIDAIKAAFDASSDLAPESIHTLSLPVQRPLGDFALSYSNLMEMDIPEPEMFVEPFLSRGGLVMVYAKRGAGKTWLALELVRALAKGTPFLTWQVPEVRKTLYIDGEMALADLKTRLRLLFGKPPCDGFTLLSSELLGKTDRPLNINTSADQKRIDEFLKQHPQDVVVLDNLSSLCYGRDENSNSELDQLLLWFRSLRHRGIAVVIIHHAGKTNEQRGASRLEDILDTSIKLTEQQGVSEGASFKIEFTKTRGTKPKPYELTVTLTDTGEGLEWDFANTKPLPIKIVILKHIYAGESKFQKDLCAVMVKDKGYISKKVKELKGEGFISMEKELSLTPKGKKELQLYQTFEVNKHEL